MIASNTKDNLNPWIKKKTKLHYRSVDKKQNAKKTNLINPYLGQSFQHIAKFSEDPQDY